MNTLTHTEAVALAGITTAEHIKGILDDLQNLPDAIRQLGDNLNSINERILKKKQELNIARNNLEAAKAQAIAFPEPNRELKNESQRQAYVTEKTETERRLVVNIENEIYALESDKLDAQNEFDHALRRFEATRNQAKVLSSVLAFYAR